MNYSIIQPPSELADLVRYFWVFEGNASKADPYTLRTIANGCPELLFHYKGRFSELVRDNPEVSFLSGIHGQTDQYRRFLTRESFGIFGVFLYPYALKSLFGISATDFTNQLPDLHSILGNDENDLTGKMFEAATTPQRLAIITNFLIQRKRKTLRHEIMFAVRQIISRKGHVNVQDLSNDCCLSHRQFERNFKDYTGFSAKTFSRIIRFNALLSEYRNTETSLTKVALDFGYYDQSHFIHDFKLFSGYNPGTYFSGKATELL